MIESTLRVGAEDLEEVLDSVLPALPGGLQVRRDGDSVELAVLALPGAPGEVELRNLAGPLLLDLTTAEVSDDWRRRRLERYQPLVVADRFLLRPEWAPSGGDSGLIEIVLGQNPAFGTGTHPTTQACLAVLAETEAGGSFADYGCGSGVLSVAAAALGWSPVLAVDIDESSLSATRGNAERNGVEVEVRRVDLMAEGPQADTIAANVPPMSTLRSPSGSCEHPRF